MRLRCNPGTVAKPQPVWVTDLLCPPNIPHSGSCGFVTRTVAVTGTSVVVDSLVSATLPQSWKASGNHRIMRYPELEGTHKVHQLQLLVLHGSPLQISPGCKWDYVGQDRDTAIVGTGQPGVTHPCGTRPFLSSWDHFSRLWMFLPAHLPQPSLPADMILSPVAPVECPVGCPALP